ncbi:MAG: transposase [Alphaproteobacteria bacterium]|nr:transposase [Alphaproteobacteria bacterium]
MAMNLYVGLDVGLNETSVCVIEQDGQSVRETKVATEPEAIPCTIEGFADRLWRVGDEASLDLWLYRELQLKRFPMIVVKAQHMRVSLSTMRNKTDRNDARGIVCLTSALLTANGVLTRTISFERFEAASRQCNTVGFVAVPSGDELRSSGVHF